MMGDPYMVLDISSDDGGEGEEGSDNYDWISELLDKVEGQKTDDSDDVVVVGEVNSNPKQNLKSSTKTVDDDEDDDDCVILDEDPDKPLEIQNDKGVVDDDDSDDLLVISEKGQIACRDYPHPRHLCAKYPFGSTPHERHCNQCHCYVCDSLAPCVYWGTGISGGGHCHATDKDKYWNAQREGTRKSDKPLSLVTAGPDTLLSVPPSFANQASRLVQIPPNYPQQNQMFRPPVMRPCSLSSSPGLPNHTRQRFIAHSDKFHNHVVSQQLRNTSINVPRDRRHNVGHMAPQFVTSRTAFKRAGLPGQALTANRCGYNSSNSNSVPQFCRNPSSVSRWQEPRGRMPVVSNTYLASSQPNAGILGANTVAYQSRIPRPPSLGGVSANYAPSVPQMPSQPQVRVGSNSATAGAATRSQPISNSLPLPHLSTPPSLLSEFPTFVSSENQVSSQTSQMGNMYNSLASPQPYSDSYSANTLPQQNPVVFHPEGRYNFEHLQSTEYVLPYQANAGTTFRNSTTSLSHPDGGTSSKSSVPSQGHLPCLPKISNSFASSCENTSASQPELCRHHISSSPDSQNVPQLEYQGENALRSSLDDFDYSWENHVSQTSNLSHVHNLRPAESPEVGRHAQFPESTTALDIQHDDWLFENSVASGPLDTGFNVLSPEAPIDSGPLFDY